METRAVMKGNHSRKTAAFVRVCATDRVPDAECSGLLSLHSAEWLFPGMLNVSWEGWLSVGFQDLFFPRNQWANQLLHCFQKKCSRSLNFSTNHTSPISRSKTFPNLILAVMPQMDSSMLWLYFVSKVIGNAVCSYCQAVCIKHIGDIMESCGLTWGPLHRIPHNVLLCTQMFQHTKLFETRSTSDKGCSPSMCSEAVERDICISVCQLHSLEFSLIY